MGDHSSRPEQLFAGDINRMISQRKRGGGANAFQDPVLELKSTELLNMPPGANRSPRLSRC
jgi:hypothetical protein